MLYAPVRFGLEVLRVGEPHYGGFTPGQYASVAATLFGVGVLARVARRYSGESSER